MERNSRHLDTALSQSPHQFGREVQSSGGSRHGTRLTSEERLVILAVFRVIGCITFDVGWQRHGTVGFQKHQKIGSRKIEMQQHFSAIELVSNDGVKTRRKCDLVTGTELARRACESKPCIGRPRFVQCYLDFRTARERTRPRGIAALADQPARQNLGVIDHHNVARLQKTGQVLNAKITELRADIQKPCRITGLRWFLGDAFARQFKIEKIDTHADYLIEPAGNGNYRAGANGNAVVDLITSMAKLDETSLKGTRAIRRL